LRSRIAFSSKGNVGFNRKRVGMMNGYQRAVVKKLR